jgi:hypothetical protein
LQLLKFFLSSIVFLDLLRDLARLLRDLARLLRDLWSAGTVSSPVSLWVHHRLQLFQPWQHLELIRHDDLAVVLAAPASMRAPWGACSRLELVVLVSFHNCHCTLHNQSISGKPPTQHHGRYVHVPVTVFHKR